MKRLAIFLFVLGFVFQTTAQQEAPSPILFIYDASGSMWGQLEGKTKKEIASDVLSTSINNLPDNQRIGLVAYGHRKKGDCEDVEFLVDLNNESKAKLNSVVKGINPLGRTPLAYSATLAINSLKSSGTKATIILITDGIESCDGNICNVVTSAKAEGIDFKLHIVGFGLKEGETEQLECAAMAGNGKYYDANNAGGLGEVLAEVTSETVDDPTDNFSIYATKNGEPVDVWIRAKKSGTKDYIDEGRSYRDSAFVHLPPGKYEIEINPLENTDIPGTTLSVQMKEGEVKHETISFDGGSLKVTSTNNGEGWDAIVKMIDQSTGKSIAQTRTYGRDQVMEVPAGIYKVTFQALTAMKGLSTYYEVENVEVKAAETTPLAHNFETGIAMIGAKTSGGELIDATINIIEVNSNKNVASGRTYTSPGNNPRKFILNPGTYKVKLVTLGKHKGSNKTVTLTVKQGDTVENVTTF